MTQLKKRSISLLPVLAVMFNLCYFERNECYLLLTIKY